MSWKPLEGPDPWNTEEEMMLKAPHGAPEWVHKGPNSWNTWYTDNEMMLKAPHGAPEWVQKAWQPMPYSHQPVFEVTKSYDCSPDGVVVEGGPQDGTIMPNSNVGNTLVANKGTQIVGIYELKKQNWHYQNCNYHRLVYIFKQTNPSVKPVKFEPKKILDPSPYEFQYEDLPYPMKNYIHGNTLINNTVSKTIDFKGVSSEMLKIMYGEAAKLDPWDAPAPEDDEVPLWDAI